MSRKDKVHSQRKQVFEVVQQSGALGITKMDVITRLSGKLGRHQVSEALDFLHATGRIHKLNPTRYAV